MTSPDSMRGSLQPDHPAYIHGPEAAAWITEHFPDFTLPQNVDSLTVNYIPLNGVSGLSMLTRNGKKDAVFTHVADMPWAPGEHVARLPRSAAAALHQMFNRVTLRADHIRYEKSADPSARVSELRNVGITVACWNQEGEDSEGVVRQFRAYRVLSRVIPPEHGDPTAPLLIAALDARGLESLSIQTAWVETRMHRELASLHKKAASSAAAVAQLRKDGLI